MSVFAINIGGLYVDVTTRQGKNLVLGRVPALTNSPERALLFSEQPHAQSFCDALQKHRQIRDDAWNARLVVEGWYVIAKAGQFLSGRTDGVAWVDRTQARLFGSLQEANDYVGRLSETSEGMSLEFQDAAVRLLFSG